MIPKIIYQAWIGPSPIPEHLLEWHKRWQELNPTWQVHLLVDETIPFLNNYRLYDQINDLRGKSDILRYELLYRTGGLWIDLDTEPVKPIPDSIRSKTPHISMRTPEHPCNCEMGAEPKDPWLAKVIAGLPARYEERKNEDITYSVGSFYLLDMIEPHVIKLPNKYFIPLNYDGKGSVTKDTIGVHQFEGTRTYDNTKTTPRLVGK